MKVHVRFEEDGHLAMVGMNNLMPIEDGRIRTHWGLRRRIESLVLNHHKYRLGKKYHVFDMQDRTLFTGTVYG